MEKITNIPESQSKKRGVIIHQNILVKDYGCFAAIADTSENG